MCRRTLLQMLRFAVIADSFHTSLAVRLLIIVCLAPQPIQDGVAVSCHFVVCEAVAQGSEETG